MGAGVALNVHTLYESKLSGWEASPIGPCGLEGAPVNANNRADIWDELWFAGARKIVVHYHIFKNAGSSVDYALKRIWKNGWASFERTMGHEPLRPMELAEFVSANPKLVSVSSHQLRPPAPSGLNVFPVVIVRDPLDRAYSCYSHERRCPPNSMSCEVARGSNFSEYVAWCLENPLRGGGVICNSQTSRLGAARPPLCRFEVSDADFLRAEALLHSIPVVGTVDRFDAFVERLGVELSSWFGYAIDIGPPPRTNVSPERNSAVPLIEKKRELGLKLGGRLLSRFNAVNRYDQALYDLAIKLEDSDARRSWRGLIRTPRRNRPKSL